MKTIACSALVVLLLLSALPLAQADESGSSPAAAASGGPGDQFKAAGQNIGAAARQIGTGVKEGAERAWEAAKAGANAAGQKLSGDNTPARNDSDKESTH
jgi:hypothetical protein